MQQTLGLAYFLISLICSAFADVMSKYLALRINESLVLTIKFTIGTVLLLPFMQKIDFRKNAKVHLYRVALLALGSLAWIYGLKGTQVALATVIKFTIPLLTMIFSYLLLKERIFWHQWLAAIIGFVGILIYSSAGGHFNMGVVLLALGAMIFSFLDVLNKAYIGKISNFETMLLNSLFSAALLSPLALNHLQSIKPSEFLLLVVLGIDSILITFFLLKALEKVELSKVAACRYVELAITVACGYWIFEEKPSNAEWIAIAVVITSSSWPIIQARLTRNKTA